jgi:hypothetical protein
MGFNLLLKSISFPTQKGAQNDPNNAEMYSAMIAKARRAQLARLLVGNDCMVGYPYPGEAKVTAAFDVEGQWRLTKRGKLVQSTHDTPWEELKQTVTEEFLTRKAVDVGTIQMIVEAQPVDGMSSTAQGALQRRYSSQRILVPVQAIPAFPPRADPR